MITHTFDEIARLEQASGLCFAGYLAIDNTLVPILLRERARDENKQRVLALNSRLALQEGSGTTIALKTYPT